MPAFVPAWKRLGLQLKNAPSADVQSDEVAAAPTAEHVTKKRKSPQEEIEDDVKRLRDDVNRSQTSKKRARIVIEENKPNATKAKPVSAPSPAQKPKSILKKSKADVAAKAEASTELARAESTTTGTKAEDEALEADDEEPPPPKTKADKKAKREARRAAEASSNASEPATNTKGKATLDYLNAYQNTRDTWKFNKNHQNQLLKDAFNLYRIPSSYDAALSSYVVGLQGAAGRERLGLQARSILAEKLDATDMPDAAYQMKVAKRIRAEKVVEALEQGQDAVTTSKTASGPTKTANAAPTSQQATALAKKRSRGRKRRSAVEVDSSSDESSSSESSSSDDDDDKPAVKALPKAISENGKEPEKPPAKTADSSDSASASSSSSSSSDASEESDSDAD